MAKKLPLGVLKEKNKFLRTIRVRAPAGKMTSDEMNAISAVARKYGCGEVYFTSRLNVEIPYVPSEMAEDAILEIENAGLIAGGTGAVVRAVFACKGTFCPHGIIDTKEAALAIEDAYGGRKLPVKFKAAVSGCPNNCGKAHFNDLGFIAYNTPKTLSVSVCNGCERCVLACKEKAITLTEFEISIDYSLCISCGDCITACKKGNIISKEKGVNVFLGGRAGRKIQAGKLYPNKISEEEIKDLTGKVIEYVDQNCEEHERLGAFLKRKGFEDIISHLDS